MDYRELCIELFGTDDVEELKQIAYEIKTSNARNAGRKKKFKEQDIRQMQDMVLKGMAIKEIAEYFHTSRQMIHKYLRAEQKPEEGYTLRITYMYKKTPCTVIDVDFLRQKIMIRNKTADILHRAFGVNEHPDWNDFEVFLGERCFPATRGNVMDLLQQLQLTDYDKLQIVEKTFGRMAEDDMWLKFSYFSREETV